MIDQGRKPLNLTTNLEELLQTISRRCRASILTAIAAMLWSSLRSRHLTHGQGPISRDLQTSAKQKRRDPSCTSQHGGRSRELVGTKSHLFSSSSGTCISQSCSQVMNHIYTILHSFASSRAKPRASSRSDSTIDSSSYFCRCHGAWSRCGFPWAACSSCCGGLTMFESTKGL